MSIPTFNSFEWAPITEIAYRDLIFCAVANNLAFRVNDGEELFPQTDSAFAAFQEIEAVDESWVTFYQWTGEGVADPEGKWIRHGTAAIILPGAMTVAPNESVVDFSTNEPGDTFIDTWFRAFFTHFG